MVSENNWTDRRIENVMGNLLRAGVLLAAFVVSMGAVIYLVRHGHAPVDYRIFHGEPADLRTVRGIVRDSWAVGGRAIIGFGLLLLIATPVVRVAFSILAFAKERDGTYVVFTLIVFSILLYSLLGST
jgi:uncharacterized membrane protein